MTTRKQAAKTIFLEHEQNGRSWRTLAEKYAPIPAGTLCRVARSGGSYWPRKWAAWLKLYFGVGAAAKTSKPRRLSEMSARALAWAFENREVF